jgi:hypothetical protein
MRMTFVTLCMYLSTDHLVICGQKWKKEWKKYQKRSYNAIDSFNVESDEEFLGFE